MAQRSDKTTISTLLRCSWTTVDRIVKRVVSDYLDEARLEGLYHLGVDEVSYRRGHRYLTVVVDHDTGRVVWVAKTRAKQALTSFYDALGPERCEQIAAVSMDMGSIYREATREAAPNAAICLDPFHAMQWVNQALESVYRQTPFATLGLGSGIRQWQRARTALRTGEERLNDDQRDLVNRIRRRRYALGRAWELKEQFRAMYRDIDPNDAANYLDAWCSTALRSRLQPFKTLAKKIRRHFDGLVASVHWGLSNSRVEGVNAKIRLINNRAHGHRSVDALAASIYLTLGGITIDLPTKR
jgi:transposase